MKKANDFYAFFEKIPEEKWIKGNFQIKNRCCAIGHAKRNFDTGSVVNFSNLFNEYLNTTAMYINDCGPTGNSKRDILDALQVIAELGG